MNLFMGSPVLRGLGWTATQTAKTAWNLAQNKPGQALLLGAAGGITGAISSLDKDSPQARDEAIFSGMALGAGIGLFRPNRKNIFKTAWKGIKKIPNLAERGVNTGLKIMENAVPLASIGITGYALSQMGPSAKYTSTLENTNLNSNSSVNDENALSQMNSQGIGAITSANNLRSQSAQSFTNSTYGLVQGLNAGRH